MMRDDRFDHRDLDGGIYKLDKQGILECEYIETDWCTSLEIQDLGSEWVLARWIESR